MKNSNSDVREYDFSKRDYDHVREMIYERVGISLSENKQSMVYSRLARRLRARNLDSFKDYLKLLEHEDAAEWEAFINSLTTNLTAFFRESHHFPILADHIAERRKSQKKIQIWCVAASTGEEPYSLAMTMMKTFKSFSPPVHILATDVDTDVLATAQQGIYPMDRLENIPQDMLKQSFLKGQGRHIGSARVRPELRSLVTFRQLNLLDKPWPIRGPFDAIFCRNIMIYFDKPTQYNILEKFVPLLSQDGLLFTGHSESFSHATDLFKLRGKTVYELAKKKVGND